MVYIDLNMVRAGVVEHPKEWPFGGYRYILAPPQRYQLTDNKKLMELMNIGEARRRLRMFGGVFSVIFNTTPLSDKRGRRDSSTKHKWYHLNKSRDGFAQIRPSGSESRFCRCAFRRTGHGACAAEAAPTPSY
jgi:hypothetical protein